VKIRRRTSSPLAKKAKRGFRGYPIATVTFYGPTADRASKVAVGIVRAEGAEVSRLERWFTDDTDARTDARIGAEVLNLVQEEGVRTVVATDGIFGCPHEEGIDYPEGESCPRCPYWAGRDRFTGERVQ
jgi:hypothetical protein